MILCDSGVWLALILTGHVHHTAARNWFSSVSTPGSVAFCRATQQSFLRLLTNASVLAAHASPPLTNQQAWDAYEVLLADARIFFQAQEPADLETQWRTLAARNTASTHLWMDAYLAAFALTGRYQFVTTDKAFRQFSDLDLILLGSS